MLIQRAGTGTIPPSGFAPPVWLSLPSHPTSLVDEPNGLILLPAQTLIIGHNDEESKDLEQASEIANYEFGWDNEHPRRKVAVVNSVRVENQCVSNAQYATFLRSSASGAREPPASWVQEGSEVKVCKPSSASRY